MIVQHLKEKDYNATTWSGGMTTELFIFPETANFHTGDFNLRISIATVETEQSTFTPLPGVDRTLIVLKGQLRLEHEDHYSIDLEEFEEDRFKGDWKTTSFGQVTDFNVMTKNDGTAIVQKIDLIPGELLTLASSYSLQFIYILSGAIRLDEIVATTSESLVIQSVNHPKFIAEEHTRIILVSVDFK